MAAEVKILGHTVCREQDSKQTHCRDGDSTLAFVLECMAGKCLGTAGCHSMSRAAAHNYDWV